MADTPSLGLLGLTLELYDQAAPELRPNRELFAGQLTRQLQKLGAVVYEGIANTREQVEARLAAFEQAAVDLIVVVHLSYAPSLIALPGLLRTTRPLLLLNTQELAGIDQSFSHVEMMANHGMHGQQDLANTLRRAGRPYAVVSGHWADQTMLGELGAWLQAAWAVGQLRQSRVGRVGWNFQDMGDFGLDETALMQQLGPQVMQVPLNLLADGAVQAPAGAVAETVADYRRCYALAPDVTDATLEASARAELAVRQALRDLNLQGFSVHYEVLGQDPRFTALPFAAAARLQAEGVGFGGEGDVTAAAAMRLLHLLGGQATFSEMFTMDFTGGTIFMSHFAEGNPTMADPAHPIQMVQRDGWVGSGGESASLAFTFRSGEITLCNLTTGPGGRLQMITTRGALESFLVPGQPTPHGLFRPARPLNDFLTAYLQHGGSHHVALVPGDLTRPLAHVASLLQLPLYELS